MNEADDETNREHHFVVIIPYSPLLHHVFKTKLACQTYTISTATVLREGEVHELSYIQVGCRSHWHGKLPKLL
jgi:hypothetical protein